MKLSRVYKKCAEFSVSADITNGNINEAKAIKTTELTFGYSYVVDAKGNPYPREEWRLLCVCRCIF